MLLLTLRETYALNRLSSFKNIRRKGGKFDHRPGRPKVLLRMMGQSLLSCVLNRFGVSAEACFVFRAFDAIGACIIVRVVDVYK